MLTFYFAGVTHIVHPLQREIGYVQPNWEPGAVDAQNPVAGERESLCQF